ncbi:uncharacterized protein LOC106178849 [Lingula anatina]|uniref:Uncharacterized protein LOC106178849 n=1 Tax=Lingula anatina TaxID=7574 RepID=A0A1S3K4U5_LINAN|nr:uncharacterized protein LOC106178849 [Lingula anatina]|eukprot:XP_013417655.1 uncharacterized protein LOC106178849 [Lingula anatina]
MPRGPWYSLQILVGETILREYHKDGKTYVECNLQGPDSYLVQRTEIVDGQEETQAWPVTPYRVIVTTDYSAPTCFYSLYVDGEFIWTTQIPPSHTFEFFYHSSDSSDGVSLSEFLFSLPRYSAKKGESLSQDRLTKIGQITLVCQEAIFDRIVLQWWRNTLRRRKVPHDYLQTEENCYQDTVCKQATKQDCYRANGGSHGLTTTRSGRRVVTVVRRDEDRGRYIRKYYKGKILNEVSVFYRTRHVLVDLGVLPPEDRPSVSRARSKGDRATDKSDGIHSVIQLEPLQDTTQAEEPLPGADPTKLQCDTAIVLQPTCGNTDTGTSSLPVTQVNNNTNAPQLKGHCSYAPPDSTSDHSIQSSPKPKNTTEERSIPLSPSKEKGAVDDSHSAENAPYLPSMSAENVNGQSSLSTDNVTYQSFPSTEYVTCQSSLSAENVALQSPLSAENITCQSSLSTENVTRQPSTSAANGTCQSSLSAENVMSQSSLSTENVTCRSLLSAQDVASQPSPLINNVTLSSNMDSRQPDMPSCCPGSAWVQSIMSGGQDTPSYSMSLESVEVKREMLASVYKQMELPVQNEYPQVKDEDIEEIMAVEPLGNVILKREFTAEESVIYLGDEMCHIYEPPPKKVELVCLSP